VDLAEELAQSLRIGWRALQVDQQLLAAIEALVGFLAEIIKEVLIEVGWALGGHGEAPRARGFEYRKPVGGRLRGID